MYSPFRVVISFIAISIIGLAFLPRLPISYTPDYTLPALQVSYHLSDASPEIVEQQATAPLENALSQLSDIKEISSSSSYGSGNIKITFDKHDDLDFKRFEVNSIIRQIYSKLPANLTYPLVSVQRQKDHEESPVLIYSIMAPYTALEIQNITEKSLQLPLLQLEELEAVQLSGANPMQLSIRYDLPMLQLHNILPASISKRIKETFKEDYSGIFRNSAGQSFFIQTANPLKSLSQLENLVISNKNNFTLYLKDVADIYLEEQPPQQYYRINGLNSITMRIEAKKGVNRLALASEVRQKMNALSASLPADYQLSLDYDDTEYLKKEMDKIYWRAGFSVMILLVFILLIKRNIRYLTVLFAGILVNLAITMLLIYILGLHIHLYTLAGLTISFGLIMDNAIVMLDHLKRKNNRRIFLALFAASLTTIAALGVVWFLPEIEKQNLMEFAQVISLNLFVSLLVALLFTPALYALVFSKSQKPKSGKRLSKLNITFFRSYQRAIFLLAKRRRLLLFFFLMLFGLPVFMLPSKMENKEWYNKTIGSNFYQEDLRPYVDKALGGTLRLFVRDVFENSGYRTPEKTKLYVSAELKPGHTLEQMNSIISSLETYLSNIKGIDKFITRIHSGEYAQVVISFKDGYDEGMLPYQLKNNLTIRGLDWGGVGWSIYGVGKGFSNKSGDQLPNFRVEMKGYNYDELENQAGRLAKKLLGHKRIQSVNINERQSWYEKASQEWVILINEPVLSARELNKFDVVNILMTNSSSSSPDFYTHLNDQNIPVYLFSKDAASFDKYRMMGQPFKINGSQAVFNEFSSLNLEKTLNTIHKEDRQYIRIVGFDYYGSHRFGQQYLEEKLEEMKNEMPVGYTAEYSSWTWGFDKVKRQYGLLLVLALAIYFICAILFENLRQPLMIIGTIPVSFIGLFLTFAVFGFYFDQGGYAAFILLGGLVVNAAIFIINDLNNFKNGSYNSNVIKAIVQKAQPILLTTLSTCLGLIPFLLEGDKEIFWFSLAAGTIGGLVFSMVAVFVVLPVFLVRKNELKKSI